MQRATPQSPPPPPKPPSPSFELGPSSFPPLPGAAGQLKSDDVFDNRLASSVVVGNAKERVRTDPGDLCGTLHKRITFSVETNIQFLRSNWEIPNQIIKVCTLKYHHRSPLLISVIHCSCKDVRMPHQCL